LDLVGLRLFNVYGPRKGFNEYAGVLIKFIDRIKNKLPLIVYGDGLQTRDFVYVQDVVNAIILAVENVNAKAEVFNIGTGKATTIRELAQTVLLTVGADQEIAQAPARAGDIKDSYADISKANKILGYSPRFTLKEGLKELFSETPLLQH
jgi:UDP-glucose 4-epimerase